MKGYFDSGSFGIGFVVAVMTLIIMSSFLGQPHMMSADKIEVTYLNIDKIDTLEGQLETCTSEKDQLIDVKEVVCEEQPMNAWLLFFGAMIGVVLAVYFGLVIYPGLRDRMAKKALEQARAEVAKEKQ